MAPRRRNKPGPPPDPSKEHRRNAVERLKTRIKRTIAKQRVIGTAAQRRVTQQLARVDRRYEALDLRRHGHSWWTIGQKLGCSHVEAHRLVYDACAEIEMDMPNMVASLRMVEGEKLDELQRIALPLAYGHVPQRVRRDEKGRIVERFENNPVDVARVQVQAISKLVAIAERRAKLFGLDMPTKVALTTPDGARPDAAVTPEEIEQRIRELELSLGYTKPVIDIAPSENGHKALTNGSGKNGDGSDH